MPSGYGSGVRRVQYAALAILFAAAAPTPAVAQRPSLGAAFEDVASTAAELEVDPPSWFPVRGTIDFGERDARFGVWRDGHVHEGQDVFADPGTPLVSIREGRVVETGDDGGRGNYVAIWSPDANRTFVYLHMLRPTPRAVGERVEAGGRIGAVGCTGSCWGYHLHLEMRVGRGTTGRPLDPLPLLRRLAKRAR
jgi:murein DD-endopeptidase MepM/ murein hydrolase activator NlpD